MRVVDYCTVPLSVSDSQVDALIQHKSSFSKLCNSLSGFVHELGEIDPETLINRHTAYFRLMNPSAPIEVLHRAIRVVADAYGVYVANTARNPWKSPVMRFSSREVVLTLGDDAGFADDGSLIIVTVAGRELVIPADWSLIPAKHRGATPVSLKLLVNDGSWFLIAGYVSHVKRNTPLQPLVGVDLGTRFLAVTYDGSSTAFYKGTLNGSWHRRSTHYKQTQRALSKRGTRSAMRKARKLAAKSAAREMNSFHDIAREIVGKQDKLSLFVFEDLYARDKYVKQVATKNPYPRPTAYMYKLQQVIIAHALKSGHSVALVNAKRTSTTCPKCLWTHPSSRKKNKHLFRCVNCGYTTNDDRVGAMNIRSFGAENISGRSLDRL
jgi:hypothetical protein